MRVLVSDVIVKAVSLFLIAMVVLAMFGRLRVPGSKKIGAALKCPSCGSYRIGRGPCTCGGGGDRK
ncbi:hypothetical protein [Chachezhania antarctica]|uniref:hypothetical protein n=1 Tax=Chachezhania antarctica TaxID=2340860 RepID=UPI000EB3A889|nr:hypothetical protein [Chachezhania antarctica]|tara:strand:+ start:4190 stop:4387 length:198 start_codon:yes stop_codon:yes gene_type:complete